MNAAGMAGNQFNDFGPQGQNVQPKAIEVYSQNLAQRTRSALNNHVHAQAMNAGVQGSPMNQQGLDGHDPMFAGNPSRAGMPAQPGQSQGNHALQDYQMQLMLLEQQNKKRLLMARQEQDNMGPHAQNPVGGQGFTNAMSPQGNRPGPSPNPTDMKRGTPKLNQQGLPGSPMPDAAMQPQRNSPVPMNFDVNQMPPGMPPQFAPGYNQMQMRPPSSHPGGFNGQPQITPQQMEMMRNGAMQPNGAWRGPAPQGMMPGQPQPMGGPMGNPQQRGNMPPPPAPQTGEQPRAQEPSPQQPAQAPPTPSQSTKANPKKKPTKDNKVTLRDPLYILSNVDIDCRSPPKRKGRTQVQLQQRPPRNLRRRRLHQHPSRQCIPSPLGKMDSNRTNPSNLNPPRLLSRLQLWITTPALSSLASRMM